MSHLQPSDLEAGQRLSLYSVAEKSDIAWTATTHPEEQSCSKEVEKVDEEYPDGGWPARLTVFGAFCALVCTFGQLSSFGTFQSWYSEHQLHDLPPSTISWIGALQLWVFFFSVSAFTVYYFVVLTSESRVASSAAFLMPMVPEQS